MISIIICSRFTEISKELENNIASTIGTPYEVICIDNSTNQYNIFQAYNEGVQRSKFPYLCFMHEDILHHTYNWGKCIINHFCDSSVGLIGISGPRFMSRIPGIWWGISTTDVGKDSICQFSIDTNKDKPAETAHTCYKPIQNTNAIKVVAVDGCFFCIKKTLFKHICFDQTNYSGFHFYDLDISLQIHMLGFQTLCVYDILIEHISNSQLNMPWLKNARIFFSKWKKDLPITTYPISTQKRKALERSNFQTMNYILSGNSQTPSRYYLASEKIYIFYYYFKLRILKTLLFK